MTFFDRNPPAFPDGKGASGVRLRDYFAGQALAGLCAASVNDYPEGRCGPEDLAPLAYRFADAMLVRGSQQ